MSDGLRLEVTEYTDLTRWRWLLKDANGAFLADHELCLDLASQDCETFTTLHDYVSWHAAPDKRIAEEGRIGAEVFGTVIGSALFQRRPATVEVILPASAEAIAYLPLEAARVQDRSLAGHDITLVIRPHTADVVPAKALTTGTLRVLGLFSLPEGGTALNLRRERQPLVHLVQDIAASGRAADVKALQYGVPRTSSAAFSPKAKAGTTSTFPATARRANWSSRPPTAALTASPLQTWLISSISLATASSSSPCRPAGPPPSPARQRPKGSPVSWCNDCRGSGRGPARYRHLPGTEMMPA